jgi:hypothetical protein
MPLTLGITVINEKEVRLRLAQEDAAAISKGEFTAIHDAISPSLLIYQGLEIEDLQYVSINLFDVSFSIQTSHVCYLDANWSSIQPN